MKGKTRLHAAEAVLAAATLLLAALLIWQCADAWLMGNAPSNRTEAGVLIEPVFSRESVTGRLQDISWALVLWLGALAAAVAARRGRTEKARGVTVIGAGKRLQMAATEENGKHAGRLRAALYTAAVILIAAGILNGGMRDVLVKAINICTECIGLG